MKISESLKVTIALAIGSTIWMVFKIIAYPKDPTELISYLKIGYPVSIFFSGIMGFFFPDRFGMWGVCIIFVQLILTMITAAGDWNLLPPGILFYALLTIPCIMSGYIGTLVSGKLRKRSSKNTKNN